MNPELPSRRLPGGAHDEDESSESGDEYVQEKRMKPKKKKRLADDTLSRKRKRKVRTEREIEEMEPQEGVCSLLHQPLCNSSEVVSSQGPFGPPD